MASVELCPLSEYLEPDEIKMVRRVLKDAGVSLEENENSESAVIERNIDDDVFVDFVDRLEANEGAADIYLPSDFEVVLEAAEHKIGSVHALLSVLESLREDFFVEEDEEEDEDEDEEEAEEDEDELDEEEDVDDDSTTAMKDEQLRAIWKAMHRGAKLAIQRGLCLFVRD